MTLRWAAFLITALGAAAGCEEDELPLGQGPGGDGGGDAQAGAGDTDAGSAGRGAGGGGRAGAGGTPGGTAGTVGGGTAGVCDELDPPGPLLTFPECPEPPFDTTGSTCSLEATRAALGCGEPGTTFRADCCLRQICEEDAECAPGARCLPRVAQAPDARNGTLVLDCQSRCGECGCGGTDDIDFQSYCVDASEDIARFDCNLEGRTCEELALWRMNLVVDELFFGSADPLSTFEQRIDACADAVNQAIVERCSGRLCSCEELPFGGGYECHMGESLFCPDASFGCSLTLEGMRTPADLCEASADYARYSECSDNVVRFEWGIGSENEYTAVFDRRSGNLRYGTANGYVAGLCGLDPNEIATITSGSPPSLRNCRTCAFCIETGEGGASGLEACAFDGQGRISLP